MREKMIISFVTNKINLFSNRIKNNIHELWSLVITGILTLIIATPIHGQNFSVSLNTYTGQSDNLFDSKLIESQSYINGTLSVGYLLSDYVRAYSLIHRSEVLSNPDFSMGNIVAGIQFRNLDIERRQWYGGLSIKSNYYSPEYDYYQSITFTGYGNFKYYFTPQSFVKLGYDFNAQSFSEVQQASNTEHVLYTVFNRSFDTGTGLKLTGRIGAQDFWKPPVYVSRGRYNIVQSSYEELLTNYLAGAELRFSQALHPKLGITLLGKWQYRLNRDTDIFTVLDGLTNPFVDYYRWDGSSLYAKMTTQLPAGITLRLSTGFGIRDYLDVPIYEYDFDENIYVVDENEEYVISSINRKDEQINYQMQFSKNWYLKKFSGLDMIETTLAVGWKNNQSNDPLYDYAGSMVSLGLNITY
jgi:hypothetical protein